MNLFEIVDHLTNVDELLREMLRIDLSKRQAVPDGTFPPGTRVRKSKMRPGDMHVPGAMATTLSFPLGPVERGGAQIYGYFVQWDDLPGLAVFIAGDALELVARPS